MSFNFKDFLKLRYAVGYLGQCTVKKSNEIGYCTYYLCN